jgi:hypothetical protein
MGLIVPRRFNGTSSKFEYATNTALVLGAQSVFFQCVFLGDNAASNQYVFGHCDSAAANGVRVNVGALGAFTFGADSTGTATQPSASMTGYDVVVGAYNSIVMTWDGGLAWATGINAYGANSGQNNGAFKNWGVTGGTNGTGSIKNATGSPFALGGRTGGTTRISNFDLYRLARWNRVITYDEAERAHSLGPQFVPQGLVFDWHDGADWGPYHLTAPSIVDINPGVTSPFAVTADEDDEDALFFFSAVLQYARPSSDIAANGWLPSSGSTLWEMLDETSASDADYIYSPDNPTTQQFEVKLSTVNDPAVSTGHVISIRFVAVNVDTTFDLNLVQNTTVLDSWSEAVTVAEGAVTRQRTLSGAVTDSITDYSNLRIRGVARAP